MHSLFNTVERWGNRLPHPTALFFYLCLAVVALSALAAFFSLSAKSPITQETLHAKSLLSGDGLQYFLLNAVKNFVGFAPVGTVLVAMLGLGIAEHSGLLPALLTKAAKATPGKLLATVVVFLGILSSIGADSGYVILIPLAGLLYAKAGKHPIAGIAVAFAGVSAGYSANLMIGPIDAILAGLSQEAAQIIAPNRSVSIAGNYYFLVASTFLITLICSLVAKRVTEKQITAIPFHLKKDGGEENSDATRSTAIEASSSKGLKASAIALGGCLLLLLVGSLPESGVLRGGDGSLANSPLTRGIVVIISLIGAICGIAYGLASGRYRKAQDCIEGMEKNMATMAGYLVLMFFAAQFVALFNWSQLGTLLAINGASAIQSLNMPTPLLLTLFVGFAALINLFIGSASAKWALLAPIFVPMLLLTGVSPEATQMAFRIGDSCTNIITPLMPYFGVVVAFMQQYNKHIGSGTIMALMLPYSLALLVSWSLLFAIWLLLDLPLGPGVYAHISQS